MNNTTLKDAILQSLNEHIALADWVHTNFSNTVSVYDGIDRRQLPDFQDAIAGVGDYPFIAVDITGKSSGPAVEKEAVEVSIFAALIDGDSYTSGDIDTVIRLPGIKKREAFRLLILDSVKAVPMTDFRITEIETVNLPIEFFPEFAVDITIVIERPYSFRDNYFV